MTSHHKSIQMAWMVFFNLILGYSLTGCVNLVNFPQKVSNVPTYLTQTRPKQFYTLEYQSLYKNNTQHCQPHLLIEVEPPTLSQELYKMRQYIAFDNYDASYTQKEWMPLPYAQWEEKLEIMLTKALIQSIPLSCLKITRIPDQNADFRLMSIVNEVSIHSGVGSQGAKAVVEMVFWLVDTKKQTLIKTWKVRKEEPFTNPKHTQRAIQTLNRALNKTLHANLADLLEALPNRTQS